MASTTKATTEAIAASSNASNNQTNSNEVVDPSSNSSAAVAQSSATSVSTISQLKAAPVVSPSSAAAISIASSGTVSKPLSNQATSSIGTAVNAKQVRGGSAAAKPGSATGSKALGVKPAHKGVVSPDTGKARGGAMPKPTTPSTTGSAKSASGQRKASNDRPVSAIAGAQKGPNASLSSNANAMTAKKGGAEGRTSTTTSAAAVSRDRPLTASHAGAMSNASGSKKENTSQSDPAATLVVVGLPPTTSLEQVRQLFEKNWTLANSRQVLPKGPKDPFGNQVYITFNQATDGVELLCNVQYILIILTYSTFKNLSSTSYNLHVQTTNTILD